MIEDFLNRQIESGVEQVGIAGFTLFARTREVTNLKSRAPTTFLEDGSAVQDHIINEPLTVSIEGVVGDVYLEKTPIEGIINQANEIIGQTSIYLPERTQSQIQRINAAASTFRDKVRQIDRAIETVRRIIDIGSETETKPTQEKFIDQMEALHYGKTLTSIDMPYRRYDSMRVTDLSITRDASGNALTFTIGAQKIRVASPLYVPNSEFKKNPAQVLKDQLAEKEDKGEQAGEDVERSLWRVINDATGIEIDVPTIPGLN